MPGHICGVHGDGAHLELIQMLQRNWGATQSPEQTAWHIVDAGPPRPRCVDKQSGSALDRSPDVRKGTEGYFP